MLEFLVRPFQSTPVLSTQRVPVTTAVRAPLQKVELNWGAVGQNPEVYIFHIRVNYNKFPYKETSRKTTKVRIQNPDDSSQYVIAQRPDQISFTLPAQPVDPNASGARAGVDPNTAYAAPPQVGVPEGGVPYDDPRRGTGVDYNADPSFGLSGSNATVNPGAPVPPTPSDQVHTFTMDNTADPSEIPVP